jgi:hypothetical protein
MSRVFLMKWYHFTVEYFEDLRNVNHCEFLIMRKQENAKYLLETKLRTWSELRKERAANSKGKETAKLEKSKGIVMSARRWGGCPNGCDHGSHYKRREDLEALRQTDLENTSILQKAMAEGLESKPSNLASRRQHHQRGTSSDADDMEDPRVASRVASIDVRRIAEEIVSSPDGTPSFISPEHRLKYPYRIQAGRDFGGTFSGRTSRAGSDSEASEEDERRRTARLASPHENKSTANGDAHTETGEGQESGDRSRSYALANRLGDAGSDHDGERDADGDFVDIDKAEAEDKSLRGSVY